MVLSRPLTHLLLLTVVALLTSAMLQAAGGLVNTAGCALDDRRADEYLAYCPNRGFLDYEHGALYYGLEPEALARMREADVLFLGSSVMQRSLDAAALAREFDARGIRWYALGFSYGETWSFARALIERHGLRPRVLVVNADPFFSDELTPVSRAILDDRFGATRSGYLYRHWLQRMKGHWCSARPRSPLCGGAARVTLRARSTGLWRSPRLPAQRLPALENEVAPASTTPPAKFVANARALLATSDVAPGCLVVTRVPSSFDDASTARTLAEAVGAHWLKPEVTGLTTFDRYHLDPDSAARWSDALLPALRAAAAPCLGAGSVTQP